MLCCSGMARRLPAAAGPLTSSGARPGEAAGPTLPVVTDEEVLAGLRAGDEAAFAWLVDQYHAALVRLARTFVPSRAVAEEVAQETWLAVLRGVDRFEGRSSLKTWIFHILANRARTIGARERRTVPVDTTGSATVDERRFDGAGAWSDPPVPWTDKVDDRLEAEQLVGRALAVLAELPESQRAVVTLRDVEGLTSKEVCDVLNISEANQRVLLHRGRARIRAALEREEAAT